MTTPLSDRRIRMRTIFEGRETRSLVQLRHLLFYDSMDSRIAIL